MTPFKFIAGPYLNHLTRMQAAATTSPGMLARFPVTNAFDNRSSKPAMFDEAANDSTISFDLNLLEGSFEDTAAADLWTILGVGTIVSDPAEFYDGAASGMLDKFGSAPEVIAYFDVIARVGEELNLFGAAKLDAAGEANFRIRNRQTGKWLKSDMTWDAAEQDVFSHSGGAGWETVSGSDDPVTFTVESLAICKRDTVTLRVYIQADAAAWFDAIALWPSVSCASIHGHNVAPFIVPTLQRSDDNAAWTTESTMTLRRDSFYVALSSLQVHRYWRILFDGQPDTGSLIHVGEIVLGQYTDQAHNPAWGGAIVWNEHQTRLESDLGEPFVHLHNVAPQRALSLTYNMRGDAEYQEFHKAIFRGARGGGNLFWIAPTEMDSDVVILGRIQESLTVVKSTPDWRTGELEVTELPLPAVPDIVHVYDAPVEDPE